MKLHIYYDDFGDYIEIYTGNHKEHKFLNLTGDLFELKNKKTKRTEGFAIHAFRKQARSLLKINGIGIRYDAPEDLLEVGVSKSASFLENIGEGVWQRIDEKTGKTVGLTLQGLKERTKNSMSLEISLPKAIELTH